MLVIFFYSNNEQNISLLGDSIYKLRFQNVELVKEINALITDNRISVRPDTMNLMGKQKNQLIWKDISMKDLSIGYFNVPSSMIEIFNNHWYQEKIPFAEERRLFYVALTRTKHNVYLLVNRNPLHRSRFVNEIYNISKEK